MELSLKRTNSSIFPYRIHFLDYKYVWLEKYNFNKVAVTGPKVSLILNMIRISDEDCANVYKQLLNYNNNVINAIRSKWTAKLNDAIDYSVVATSFRFDYCTTNDTIVRPI